MKKQDELCEVGLGIDKARKIWKYPRRILTVQQ
jgi:hypothetical protein